MRALRAICRLSRLAAVRSMCGYALYIKKNWKLPQVQACKAFAQRGKLLAKMYKALPVKARESLAKQGKLTKARPKAPKRPRKAGVFAKFVKKYFNAHRKQMLAMPFNKRLKLIAAEFHKLHPKVVVPCAKKVKK